MPEQPSTRKAELVDSELYSQYQNCDRWAVIVGISKYQYQNLNLKYADQDAEDLYQLLLTPNGGSFQADHIRKLTNKEATRDGITRGLRGFLKKPAREDLVLIYFACHGAPDPERPGNVYLLTHDTDPNDIAGTALPMADIDRALKDTLLSEKVIVLADTCHSAAIGGGMRSTGGIQSAALINSYLKEISVARGGIALLTSAEANEVSFEGETWGGGHGVFTYYLLEGLKGEADSNQNGFVTAGELFEYVRENVKKATNHKQHPSIGTNPFDRNLPLAITTQNPNQERATSNLLTSSSLLLLKQREKKPNVRSVPVILALVVALACLAGFFVVKTIIDRDTDSQAKPDNPIEQSNNPAFEETQALEKKTISLMSTDLTQDTLNQCINDWERAIQLMENITPNDVHYLEASQKISEYKNQHLYTEALQLGLNAVDVIQKLGEAAEFEEWEAIRTLWRQAIDKLEKIQATDPNYPRARTKIREYEDKERYAEVAGETYTFYRAASIALKAGEDVTTAKSREDWLKLAVQWEKASDLMSKVPTQSGRYEVAQQRVAAYQFNKKYAQQQAEKLVSRGL